MVFLAGCQEIVSSDSLKLTKIEIESSSTDSVKEYYSQGMIELHSFESTYESKWSNQPEKFPYTNDSLVKIYRLDCQGRCRRAEFLKRTSKAIVISRNDLIELVDILKNSASYNNTTAACYDPGFGLVVYDSHDVPSEFLSICMNCNSARTYPGSFDIKYDNEWLYGFSTDARNKIRALFKKWGLDYYGYSSFWDDEAEYNKFLKENDAP